MLSVVSISIIALIGANYVDGQCIGRADIVFAVPGSNVVPGQEFFPFERFLINLVSYFRLDTDLINVGLIIYGKEAVPISWPQPFLDHKQTNTRVTLLSQRKTYESQLNGGNDVAAALNLMREMFRNPTGNLVQKPRRGIQKIGVVFTYDSVAQEDRIRVVEAAQDAKMEGAILYAVGKGQVGPEFASIGSDYCKSFSMGRFIDGLPSVLAFLGSSICTELDPRVNISAANCFPQLYQRKEPEPVICSPDSVIFPDPENCAYFYHCLFQRPVQESCPPDMLYDPIAQSCNWKQYVSCYSDITCPQKDGLFPHPGDCSKYVNCFDFRPYIQSCPGGLWFDATTGLCEAATSVACTLI